MPILFFMSHPPNFLRLHRKRSPLTQADIAYLMSLPDYSNISRCEKGQRSPSVELLLVYHHLFDTSVESFFEPQSDSILSTLLERIKQLASDLKKEEDIPKNASRIRFLEEIFIRLTKWIDYGKNIQDSVRSLSEC